MIKVNEKKEKIYICIYNFLETDIFYLVYYTSMMYILLLLLLDFFRFCISFTL